MVEDRLHSRALKVRIKKDKNLISSNRDVPYCPSCGECIQILETIWLPFEVNYCPNCGQHIRWN